MAYIKQTWTDQVVENPRTYNTTINGNSQTITLTDAFGQVTDLGTPVDAEHMNHIEEGIEAAHNLVLTTLQAIYPVGSIYIGTQSTCPLASLFGTWEKVPGDKVLQTSSSNHNANTTIAASLPTLSATNDGSHNHHITASGTFRLADQRDPNPTGVFTQSQTDYTYNCLDDTAGKGRYIHFDLDKDTTSTKHSHSVTWTGHVGTTVQPDAYVVNIWRRTA